MKGSGVGEENIFPPSCYYDFTVYYYCYKKTYVFTVNITAYFFFHKQL